MTAVNAEVSYFLTEAGGMVRPFVRGGAGVNIERYEPGDIATVPTSATRFGFTAGLGTNVMAGALDVVVGARFTSTVDGGFLALHAGISIPLT